MLFSSLTFLFIFLPIVIGVYFIFPNRAYRNLVLLVASLIFYAWGEPIYILLMLFSLVCNYIFGIFIGKYNDLDNKQYAKRILILSVIFNIGLLGFYKYADFLIVNINAIFNTNLDLLKIPLPIGISFYTFQILSYVIDVYYSRVKVQRNILYLATYKTLFPQLIAGPIVRYETVEHELTERNENFNDIALGLRRFVIGLGKKVIIANNMAIIADKLFAMAPSDLSIAMAWIGLIAYAFQIYYDFSGYSDMAIGLGKMFGFNFLENFNYPYISRSITEFWRRWHISLGSWFRDYVYIPLGGNRVGKIRWIINIFVVWALTGIWHGAEWNFVLWGVYFGIILLLEKFFLGKILQKLPIISNIYALFLILFGWLIFRSTSVTQIVDYFGAMFNGYALIDIISIQKLDILYLWPYFVLAVLGMFPIFKYIFNFLDKRWYTGIIYDLYLVVVFLMSIMFLVSSSYNPFIYFRF